MRFAVGERPPVDDPSADVIAQGLRDLDGNVNSFAVLSSSDTVFVQVAGSIGDGFVLEYKDGVGHYQASSRAPLEVVARVFQQYASGQPGWRDQVEWHPFSRSRAGAKGLSLIVAVIVLTCLLWLAFARLLHR